MKSKKMMQYFYRSSVTSNQRVLFRFHDLLLTQGARFLALECAYYQKQALRLIFSPLFSPKCLTSKEFQQSKRIFFVFYKTQSNRAPQPSTFGTIQLVLRKSARKMTTNVCVFLRVKTKVIYKFSFLSWFLLLG